ncbi:hypothetical protein B0H13DRAFT_2651840, partial [Mycena leptocephala]
PLPPSSGPAPRFKRFRSSNGWVWVSPVLLGEQTAANTAPCQFGSSCRWNGTVHISRRLRLVANNIDRSDRLLYPPGAASAS